MVSGPAGAGKGTLVARLAQALPGKVWVSISATTRAPRGKEQHGVEYLFKTVEEFEAGIEAGAFLEWACVHGNFYGTPVAPIEEAISAGQACILEIDVQGGFQVRERFPEARLIFIAPPSMEELRRRITGRGTDSPEAIETRMANAAGEMEAAVAYDLTIVNDNLNRATEELVAVVKSTFGQNQ